MRGFLPARGRGRGRGRDRLEAVAAAGGWLAEDTDPAEWVAGPSVAAEGYDDPDFWAMYRRVQSLQGFHEFAHHLRIIAAMRGLLEDEVFVHSNHVARVVGPSDPDRAHPHPPGLEAHPRSGRHPDGVDTAGRHTPSDGRTAHPGGIPARGRDALRSETESIRIDDHDPRWRDQQGDVLIFHSHRPRRTPNTTDRLRRSCEFRYQRVSDPAVASTVRLPHWYPSVDWPQLTKGWTSLASIEVPDFVEFEQLDDTAPHLPTPPSRLLGTA